MMKSNSLDNAPTQSLLSVVNGILDESVERKNGEIPHRVACLLRKVVQEIERRISTQAEHIRNQNNLIKAREEKYQSRIRVLETLATGTSEEAQIVTNQLQMMKKIPSMCNVQTEKIKSEDGKRNGNQDVVRLTREKENSDLMITELKQQMEKKDKSYEQKCVQLELKVKETKIELEEKIKDTEFLLEKSKKRTKELEALTETKAQSWNNMEHVYRSFINSQLRELKALRISSDSIKNEVLIVQRTWHEEFLSLGTKLGGLVEAAQNYHIVLYENRKLYNEVQELKGNIRVFCRIRPFLPGQSRRMSTIESIGEDGELSLVNPSKQGKDGHRVFKFNRVFGPASSQEQVFLDTQPLIRSVLDGYNVCIFAYGQTGSGKTYTMSGPNGASKEEWGVNYRALNDLFLISRNRRSTIMYEIGVQMVEIYNEQVRDLLSNNSNQKKYPSVDLTIFSHRILFLNLHTLGVLNTSQPNGLAVPEASMHLVNSTTDVLDLMQIGQKNRVVSATALNERSSRSHSILSVHVRGMDLESGSSSRGSLHLVDLAGSERVDRSEVTGDRLKEAQHINKSLSALGDVIFALAQKNSHIPYRNSKLTQVLQSSLGGQAKTLMFVQLNPDVESYSETFSTLKFAERVSGVELGAARSNKEGKDVKELMEQVASLKDMITRKDEEIEGLQLLKDLKTQSPGGKVDKHAAAISLMKHPSSSSSGLSQDGISPRGRRPGLNGRQTAGLLDQGALDASDVFSNESDINSEVGSFQSVEASTQQKQTGWDTTGQTVAAESELLGFGEVRYEERLSDISDSVPSMGTETDGSMSSVVEFSLFPEATKPNDSIEKISKGGPPPREARAPPQKSGLTSPSQSRLKETPRSPSARKAPNVQPTASTRLPISKRWQ
ncbi:hypothetical protein Taro_045160 [Colocasia esculenta]|uniref:Kinesin-like protein n=1 Tax=Colocasia esculenta TaxID=4460 RepID=A0A843X3T3_COLES|nr:hypothetical protein [Colocasia esculenta]